MAGHGGHCEYKNSKQQTDQTVMTITKALTKTTNCTFKARFVEGHDQKRFPALCSGLVPPNFKIRSGVTAHGPLLRHFQLSIRGNRPTII